MITRTFVSIKIFVCLLLISLSLTTSAANIEYQKRNNRFRLNETDTVKLKPEEPLLLFWNSSELFDGPYSCMITGFSNGWSEWFDNDFVYLTSLPEGTYTFQLRNSRNKTFTTTIYVKGKSNWIILVYMAGTLTILLSIIYLISLLSGRKKLKSPANPITQDTDETKLVPDTYREPHSKTKSQKYKKVTVLFADIQGFTRIVEHMNPEQLIDELDKYFIYFDEVVEKFNIEKIKTIGDAYMCAGGLPFINRTNPVDVVLAAQAMQAYVKSIQHYKANNEIGFWELRIGIHTGSVISGMIGHKKRYFDIWGDSVNIASRMESSGIAGEINITGVTYNLIKDFFVCEYRGKMPIKYKGETDMYFVRGIVPSLSVEGLGRVPNSLFHTRLQQNILLDMIDYLNEKYPGRTVSQKLFTSFLITNETLARAERVTETELLIIKTIGVFVFPYLLSSGMKPRIEVDTRSVMQKFRYSESQIQKVTSSVANLGKGVLPQSTEEKIVADAYCLSLLQKNFIRDFFIENTEKIATNSLLTRSNLERLIELISRYRPFTASFLHLAEVEQQKQAKVIKHFFIFDNREKQI
jgi:class 3 adenylate cyclase